VRAPGALSEYAFSGNSEFVDWGTLSIDGNAENTWFTLSSDEWDYLLNTRTNAASLHANIAITGITNHPANNGSSTFSTVYGYVFFPDDFDASQIPSGITLTRGTLNSLTVAEFRRLEAVGAIFLPAAGYRTVSREEDEDDESYVDIITSENTGYLVGQYWTSTVTYVTKESAYKSKAPVYITGAFLLIYM